MADAWCDDCGEQGHDLFTVRVNGRDKRLCWLCWEVALTAGETEDDPYDA